MVAHELTNKGSDRSQLLPMATAAKIETQAESLTVLADRGYYEGWQLRACDEAGITALVPKPDTSPARARGLWAKDDFTYRPDTDTYRCPMGEELPNRFSREEDGKILHFYFNQKACQGCSSRAQCTTGKEKRIRRWEHETVSGPGAGSARSMPEAMDIRRCTVEHVFATLKQGMGATTSEREASETSPQKQAWRSWPTI